MTPIMLTVLAVSLLLLNFVATLDINGTGVLEGRQRVIWLSVIWLLPFVGFLIFQLAKPRLYRKRHRESNSLWQEDPVGDAVEALLDLTDTD